MEITIDKQFKALIPPLTDAEFSALEADILANGIRDSLVLWGDFLLDGHHRYAICQKHGLKYLTTRIDLPDRDAAKMWVIHNQFARRNLTPFQRAELALKLEPLIRKKAKERQKAGGKKKVEQNSAQPGRGPQARDELAKEAGVSHNTIAKVKYIKAHASEDVQKRIRKGEISINAEYLSISKPHVSHATGDNEWYTPPEYIKAATAVLGVIDCDPASSAKANKTVGATQFYTAKQNGLEQTWGKRVWMNPPYAQPLCSQFCKMLAAKVDEGEVKKAIVLVNNATETSWFAALATRASAIVFPVGRVKFLDAQGSKPGAPLQGQAVIYIGASPKTFLKHFLSFGWGMTP